ncbi:MAG: hypothetical protein AAB209_04880 [Bacteroidota bacterium]
MTIHRKAIYDGKALQFTEPVELKPNTEVNVILEVPDSPDGKEYAFFETALSMDLQGPSDWSTRFEEYLHTEKHGTSQ